MPAATLSSDTVNRTETNAAADISATGTLTISDLTPERMLQHPDRHVGQLRQLLDRCGGDWTYTASSAHDEFVAGTTYTDTFAVTSADGTSTSVTINITGTNDPAVLSSATVDLTEADSAAAISTSGQLSVSDVDSDPSFNAQTGTSGSYGSFSIDAGGAWTYTASSAHDEFVAGTTYTDTFAVTSADGTSTSVTINITGTNDPAVLSSATVDLTEADSAAAISTSGQLSVSDVDSDPSFNTQTGIDREGA